MTLMEVAKEETSTLLQQLAHEVEEEERDKVNDAIDRTVKGLEDGEKRSGVEADKQKTVDTKGDAPDVRDTVDDDKDGYSSFGEEEQPKVEESSLHEETPEEPFQPTLTVISDTKECKHFIRAVYKGDKRCVQSMLDAEEVEVNAADQHGWSGLHWAASQGHSQILQLLLQYGGDPNAVDHISGWTPLHVATIRESIACAKVLLQAGTDLRVRDIGGDSVFDCLHAVLATKTPAHARKSHMQTLLHEHGPRKSIS